MLEVPCVGKHVSVGAVSVKSSHVSLTLFILRSRGNLKCTQWRLTLVCIRNPCTVIIPFQQSALSQTLAYWGLVAVA
jgi:hypothetical protein